MTRWRPLLRTVAFFGVAADFPVLYYAAAVASDGVLSAAALGALAFFSLATFLAC
ncbi:MAG: hypothetical protein HY686_06195 [Chloroflexi bacterium]|nr:hypothetical protein [Chloroflexota bacterium]